MVEIRGYRFVLASMAEISPRTSGESAKSGRIPGRGSTDVLSNRFKNPPPASSHRFPHHEGVGQGRRQVENCTHVRCLGSLQETGILGFAVVIATRSSAVPHLPPTPTSPAGPAERLLLSRDLRAVPSSPAVISPETCRGRERRRGKEWGGEAGRRGEWRGGKGECGAATAGNFVSEFSACVS